MLIFERVVSTQAQQASNESVQQTAPPPSAVQMVLQVSAFPMASHHGDGTGQETFGGGALGNPLDEQAIELEVQWARPAPSNCAGTASDDAWMDVIRRVTGYGRFVTRDPIYGEGEQLLTWSGFTDEGIGMNCDPEVTSETASQVAWWALKTTGSGSYWDLSQGVFTVAP